MITTVGIDLAADPSGTAIAGVTWGDRVAVVGPILTKAGDDIVLHWMRHPDAAIGIDCPFGWPAKFVDLVSRHSSGDLQIAADLPKGWRRDYVLRDTDRWIHETVGIVPLSVAADRIGHTAIRLAALMAQLGPHISAPFDGSGALVEVYPAAALKIWGLPFRAYKRGANLTSRGHLVDALKVAAPWLKLGEHEADIRASDDALDALICALVARCVWLGLTHPPRDRAVALREGWIHVPSRPLSELP